MLKKIIYCTTLILFLFYLIQPILIEGQEKEDLFKYRKDPFLSGLFSFYIPGLGQAYAGDVKRGAMFFVTENVLFWGAILNFSDFNFNFVEDFGFEFSFKQKSNLTKTRIYTSIGLGLLFLTVKVYDIIDAVDTAKLYNEKIVKKELKHGLDLSLSRFSIGIIGIDDNKTTSLLYQIYF